MLNNNYTENLKLVKSLLGDGITYGKDLFRVSKQIFGDKFLGVYDEKDRMPVLKKGECIIINKPTNQHWIGRTNVNGTIEQYDSFNRKDFIGGFKNGDFDNSRDQNFNQSDCGSRVIAWLVTVLSK